jgi:UDP-N-acetylmuramoyl-L-alanyl-D-glutamate--2,6-diaminopimelate ligase
MLGSIACLLTIGISLDRIVKVSRSILLPNGRMQRMIGKKVWIDFSHTPDALKEAICALKLHYLKHNIIVVFGCGGGNRDKVKRAKMGQVADRFANHIILTNDNSRSEPSKEIIKDIKSGIYYHKPQIIPNRNQAITKAILNLKQNDCLLIAGKGHEQFQIIDNQKIPQNDSQIASDVIRKFC